MYTTSKTTACTSDELHVMTENDFIAGVGKENRGIKKAIRIDIWQKKGRT
jgi:hypothetical protein